MDTHEVITAARPADEAAGQPSALRAVLPSAFVIVVYVLLGIVAFWPVFPGISQRLFSAEGDYAQSVWYLDWISHAIAHGLNPFFSSAIDVPTGVNLAQNTESPLLGLITAPFAPVLSPVVRANALMLLAMPASATAAFVVLRKWRVWRPGAAIGGLIYGFSPYMVGQGTGHVELIFLPLPPFIAWTIVSIMERSGSPRRLGIQLGLLVVAQYLVSPEVLATIVVFTIAALACVAIHRRNDIAALAHTAVKPFGVALGVAAVLLAYPFWMLVAGPQHVAGPTVEIPNPYHNDLLNFVVPGPIEKVSLGMGSLGAHLNVASIPSEVGGYIGVPVLILAGVLVWLSRRSPRMQLTVVLFLGAVLLSLGPYLAVDGHLSDIPLPFLLVEHLPLLDNILPSRISFEVGAFLAAMLAFGLDDVRRTSLGSTQAGAARRRSSSRWVSAVLVGATLAVLVITQLPQWPYASAEVDLEGNAALPATALPAHLLHAIPAGDPVAITYPYDTFLHMNPMLWQAEDGFDFRLLGGYAYHPNSSGHSTLDAALMRPRGLQQFLANQGGLYGFGELYGSAPAVGPQLVAATRAALTNYHVHLVIVDRLANGSGPVMQLFTAALGPATLSTGHFSMWTDWHGWPRHEKFVPHIVTNLLRPAKGASLSGTAVLDADASAWQPVTRVEFLLTDENHLRTIISGGEPTYFGWFAEWNTSTIANGRYSLQSIAYDAEGASRLSPSVPITIKNLQP
jgi:hypothetical protein